MNNYHPEFQMSEKSTQLLYEIAKDLERINIISEKVLTPKLRRESRIKSINSSLAIEGNQLSPNQVTDIINGKPVVGDANDIAEVKGAEQAYEHLLECNPYDVKDLLTEHKYMMGGVDKGAGRFRSHGEVVRSGDTVIHVAPPAEMVPVLISSLFAWTKESSYPQIIKTCVFHYEFEFIHPFSDGNGRMGRLWQTRLLYEENPIFAWLPVESIIAANQEEYYRAIRESTTANNCSIFVDFMLSVIAKAVSDFRQEYADTSQIMSQVDQDVLAELRLNPAATAEEIAAKVQKDARTVRRSIALLKEQKIISRVGSNKTGYWKIEKI